MKQSLIEKQKEGLRTVPWPVNLSMEGMRFALFSIQGHSNVESYRRVVGDEEADFLTSGVLHGRAAMLSNNPDVQTYKKALLAELERVSVANVLDIKMFLSAAVFTPISQIDEDHPLCQEKTTTTTTNKDGTETTRVVLKSVSKMDAAKMLAKIEGMEAPLKVDHTHKHGIMVVPMASGVEDWEAVAAGSQKALMEDAVLID